MVCKVVCLRSVEQIQIFFCFITSSKATMDLWYIFYGLQKEILKAAKHTNFFCHLHYLCTI